MMDKKFLNRKKIDNFLKKFWSDWITILMKLEKDSFCQNKTDIFK